MPSGVDHRLGQHHPLSGAGVLPKGSVSWESAAGVTVARGQPAPSGSETPASSTNSWLDPFGPLAGGTGHPLLFTDSLILAILLGTIGLPHILVRFYTNPDARASRRTALVVLVLLGAFYIWPPALPGANAGAHHGVRWSSGQ